MTYSHTCRHCGETVEFRVRYRKPVACGRHACQQTETLDRMQRMADRGDSAAAAYLASERNHG